MPNIPIYLYLPSKKDKLNKHLDLISHGSKPEITAIHHTVIKNKIEDYQDSGSLDLLTLPGIWCFEWLHDPAYLEYKDIYPFSWEPRLKKDKFIKL